MNNGALDHIIEDGNNGEGAMLNRLAVELEAIDKQKKKNQELVERSRSAWLIQTISGWSSKIKAFLN